MTFPAADEEFSSVCPYLGLADDADSHATYATEAHRCYRLDNPTRIATNHQNNFCLGENHIACPIFKGEGIAATTQPAAAAPAAASRAPAAARPPREPKPAAARPRAAGGGDRPRKPPTGSIGPRPRPGGISMPVATVGLFALAIIVIAIAFLINSAVGGGDKLSPAEVNQTNTAVAKKATPGATTPTPGGATATNGTARPGTTTATGTAAPRTATPAGSGAGTYTVESGDNCGAIADKNGITLDQFFTLNPTIDRSCNNLAVGQVVKVK